jgi:hypothetical protein
MLQLTKSSEALSALQINHADLEQECSRQTHELETFRTINGELKLLLQAETNKNIELGSELLTLLNQKDACLRKADELEGQLNSAVAKIAVSFVTTNLPARSLIVLL